MARSRVDVRKFYNLTSDPIRLDEQHRDFQLNTVFGVKYLDLMEVAVLDATGGFDGASNFQQIGELADAIYTKIQKKVENYGTPTASLHLLLYRTDFRFDLTVNTWELLAHRLNRRDGAGRPDHCFRTVLFCSPRNRGH